ncbi:MAG: response regulator [Verrucomicrobiales bacterium]|nr:response regulator [Verrucomicrobiales bacterium]
METKQGRPAEILLVEDNDDDVFITRKGLEAAKLAVNLNRVENGRECMDFLRKKNGYEDVPTPDLILLDLNMPIMDGREVMAEIAKDKDLCKLPVVVLTTSTADNDLLDMYHLRCSSYIKKPVDFDQFKKVIHLLGDYWFNVVILPTRVGDCSPPG